MLKRLKGFRNSLNVERGLFQDGGFGQRTKFSKRGCRNRQPKYRMKSRPSLPRGFSVWQQLRHAPSRKCNFAQLGRAGRNSDETPAFLVMLIKSLSRIYGQTRLSREQHRLHPNLKSRNRSALIELSGDFPAFIARRGRAASSGSNLHPNHKSPNRTIGRLSPILPLHIARARTR